VDVGFPSLNSSTNMGTKIFAIGDLNNDKFNDLVTVSEDQSTFQAFFYKGDNYTFE
jgi:hypothetical protein